MQHFIFFDTVVFNEKNYDFEEWEGDIVDESLTTIYTEYNIYVDPNKDEFYIYRYQKTVDYDLRRYYREPLVEEIENIVSFEDIKEENENHYRSVRASIEKYYRRQYHVKNKLYYELMEKSMHPDRIEWIF